MLMWKEDLDSKVMLLDEQPIPSLLLANKVRKERGREGEREGGREGREGGKKGGREGWKEEGREGLASQGKRITFLSVFSRDTCTLSGGLNTPPQQNRVSASAPRFFKTLA